MAKQTKQAFRERERTAWPAWVWLGIGVLLGLAISATVLIKDWAPMLRKKNLPQPNAEATAPKESEQSVADEAGKKPAPPKKAFDFYYVLPEMEVVIPDAELSAKARAEQQRQQQLTAQAQNPTSTPTAPPPPSTDPNARYALLAGSYGDSKTADEAKAKLAMLGIVAKVQSVSVNGKTWNRVMVGPYASASDTEAAQKTLSDAGVKAIPMKQATP
ncbi:MAG TPA: SPOR domain-containing protein [Rudaea sp.]|jgi:cell division protein FtsN|nr:SPOR domain-containing protein [Rudaea sp.]